MAEISEKRISRYRWAIAAIGAAVIMGALGFARFGYTLILPRMAMSLGLTETGAGGVATANLLGYLVFSLLGGVLATKYSPRRVIVGFLALTSIALFCTGLSKSVGSAAVWRFLAGAGGGANVPMMGLISTWFSSQKRGLASGIVVSGSSFGLLLTGIILPPVMAADNLAGWRHGWYILGGITVIITVVSLIILRDMPPGAFAPKARDKKPVFLLMKSGRLWLLAGIYLLFGFSYVIFATFFARYLRSEALLTEKAVGGLWSLIGGLSIASGFLWGFVSDRFSRRTAFVWIFTLQSAGYFTFALWQAMPGYLLASLLFAVTAWSIPAVMGATVGDFFGASAASAAFGFVTLIFGIGQSLGPIIAGAIADSVGTFKPAFLLAAAVAIAGAPVSFLVRSHKSTPENPQKVVIGG